MSTKIVKCDCKHDYQDKKHGVGRRVSNYARNANNKVGCYRCTVCEKIHPK